MNACKPVLVITLILLASTALAGHASHGPINVPGDREFQVLGAQWGTGHRWADVTEKACELSTEVGLDVVAGRRHFGDPYPHFKKALVVFYLWRGELHSATMHENGRLRIPLRDKKAAAMAVQSAAEARVAAIVKEVEAGIQAARLLLDEAVQSGSIDGIKKAVRKRGKLTKGLLLRLDPKFDEFESFLARHPSQAASPGLAEIREQAAVMRTRFTRWAELCRTAKKGMREITGKLASTSDWRNLKITAERGDLVAFEAEGTWSFGRYAGTCDATGLAGERYAGHSHVRELPHGCLLVRVGTNLFGAASKAGTTHAAEDRAQVEARSNDTTYRDNAGEVSIRVLVVPAVAVRR